MSPGTILLIASGLLGLIIGSFLNALSFRFNTGQRFFSKRGMGGRSRCMHCGHELSSLDLIPVLSFAFLGARCRYCRAKLSWQYPLVEVSGTALGILAYQAHSTAAGFAFWFLVWMTLLFVVVYDIKHTIIPWSCSGLLAVLAALSLFINFDTLALAHPGAWQLLSGPLLALPLFLLSLVSLGTWMGWGDSALELSLGWFLGLSAGATAMLLGFWIGAFVGVLLILLSTFAKRLGIFGYTIRSEMPFAPFLVLGALIAHFFHVDFFSTFGPFF